MLMDNGVMANDPNPTNPKIRLSGIEPVGNIPWGTHFCQFYQTQDDLLSVLVPYFRAGLENNEFCMLVTAENFDIEKAKQALQAGVPGFLDYLKKGQMEIIDYKDWYIVDGKFDANRVLKGWISKLNAAVKLGYDGLRLSGNTFWLEKKDWAAFSEYEKTVDDVIGKYNIIANCNYFLGKCNAGEIIDVVSNHEFALIRRRGQWDLIKSSKHKKDELQLEKLNRILKAISDSNHSTIRATEETTEEECFKKTCKIIIEDCGYPFVWIGLTENDSEKSVQPMAYAGFEKDYINNLNISWADSERGRGPTGTAIRTGKLAVCRNMATDPNFAPWRENALKRGFASSLVLPLKVGNSQAFGAINIYSSTPNGFTEEETNLFLELADDLAYEISALRARKELQITEKKFESIFEFSPVGMFLLDIEGNVLDCNEMAVSMCGVTEKKQFLGKNCFDFIDNSYQELARKKWTGILKKGFVGDFEVVFTAQGGRKINALVSATLLLNVGQKPYSIITMVQDITQKKVNEEAILMAKQEWEKTFDNMPDLIAVIDANHKILKINKTMVERLGGTGNLNEYMGLNCFKCVHNLNAPPQFCPHSLTLKDGKPHTAEIYEKTLNGTFLVTTTPLLDKNGKITGSVHVARDITKIKKASQKLRKTARKLKIERVKYAALLSSIGHGVAAVDKNGRIMFANKKINAFLNGHYKSLMGKKLLNVLDLYDKKGILVNNPSRPFLESLGGQTIISRDYYCIDKNKKKIYLDVATSPIFLQNKIIGAIGVYEDITKEKEIEKAKTEFVSLASHQLRTPITEIGLSAEMLTSGMAGKIANGQKKYLKNINDGVKEITGLIETLLNISRMQMGTFLVNPKPLNLPVLVDKLVGGFSMQIKKKKLLLKKNYEKGLPKINLDPQVTQLIFENLFSNAIKYTEKGSVEISIWQDKKNIKVAIEDTGCGIPDQQKHMVFTKLFRADNLLKNKTKGHGLGLYIVQAMVKNAGGKISFESEEGKGTTFYVSFPLAGMKKKIQQSLI